MSRVLPWTALLEALGESRFAEIKDVDPLDRDAFVLNGAAGQLLKDLVPPDGPAEAVTAYAALLHMVWLARSESFPVREAQETDLRRALSSFPSLDPPIPRISYLQLPPHLAWAGDPPEPIDGLFVSGVRGRIRVLAVLGLRPPHEDFTTMEAESALPAGQPGTRPDGSAAFASVLPGGDRARLISVVSPEELVALGVAAVEAASGRFPFRVEP